MGFGELEGGLGEGGTGADELLSGEGDEGGGALVETGAGEEKEAEAEAGGEEEDGGGGALEAGAEAEGAMVGFGVEDGVGAGAGVLDSGAGDCVGGRITTGKEASVALPPISVL